MKKPNHIRVIKYETPRLNPFDKCGVRELARRTGLDASNLSKVKSGKLAITQERLQLLVDACRDSLRHDKPCEAHNMYGNCPEHGPINNMEKE